MNVLWMMDNLTQNYYKKLLNIIQVSIKDILGDLLPNQIDINF